ncbi:MAG: right-handed parallel beta-helix repeat-containing protein [Acidimicrobiales bacterium]
MAGSGELFKGSDGKWAFRVKASNGKVVAVDNGVPGYGSKTEARTVLKKLLSGGYDGPIREPAAVTCGQEIKANTTLDGDLLCTGGPALIVTADNVVLDLGGFTISGQGSSAAVPGILLRNVKGVTVRKGTVKGFGAGVAIEGGSKNVVENMTLQDNIGSTDGDFGDGITVKNSSGNILRGNTVRRNGPFAGISLVGPCTKNEIRDNVISDNNMLPGEPSMGRQDMGIRVEGPGADNNKIIGNTVTGSGAEGICILPTCTDPQAGCAGTPGNESNEISENLSHNNGTSGQGSGIRLFAVPQPVAASKTVISNNVTNDNVTFGIAIDAAGAANPGPPKNKVTGNSGKGNGQFDGFDGNTPACGSNVWKDNDFAKVSQPCVGA